MKISQYLALCLLLFIVKNLSCKVSESEGTKVFRSWLLLNN